MSRALPEWIGANPDTPAPPRVRLRVFEAYSGKCYRSGRKIMAGDKWQLDHVKAIINGGENRESNLAPILDEPHKAKTREDLDEKSKVYRIRAKHLGLWPKGQKIASRGFGKTRARPPVGNQGFSGSSSIETAAAPQEVRPADAEPSRSGGSDAS